MASISITEKDFNVLFGAANDAHEGGDIEAAKRLDRLARKASAALTNGKLASSPMKSLRKNIKWQEAPSTLLDEAAPRRENIAM